MLPKRDEDHTSQPCRHLVAVCLINVGALAPRNPMGPHGL
jgi:hypothetical protein